MQKQPKTTRVLGLAVIATALMLALAGTAQAKLVEPFLKFQYCPYKNIEVKKCLYSVTTGGEVVLGSKKVPIEKPVLLQGGFGKADKITKISKFFAATEGKPTLQPVAQNLPGGLAGLVNCKEISNFILKAACEWTFENGLTGASSTLELAKPASAIQISELNLSRKEGLAMQLPVKVHLENPLLGSSCYVGSESNPVIWNLTSGVTSPPEGTAPIEGSAGKITFLEEGLILHIDENSLVDNTWAGPAASGCGGIFSFILDPIINAAAGLPAAAGKNSARLNNTLDITTPAALEIINEQNP